MNKKKILIKSALICLLLLFFCIGIGESSNVEYRIEFELPPLSLSQQDLIKILQKIHNLASSANKDIDSDRVEENLSLSGSGVTIKQKGEPQIISPMAGMDVANSVDYDYSCYIKSGAPISKVNLRLYSFGRQVSIGGTSQEQVEAIAADIRQSFDRYVNWFGGTFANILMIVAADLFFIFFGMMVINFLERKYGPGPYWKAFLPWAIIIGISLPFLFDWMKLFPKVAIYKESSSFIIRNTALFTFIGLVVGIIALILAIVGLRYPKPTNTNSASPSSSEIPVEKDDI